MVYCFNRTRFLPLFSLTQDQLNKYPHQCTDHGNTGMRCNAFKCIPSQVRISTNSEVASHCSVFALSVCTKPDLLQQWDHRHQDVCKQCENLNSMLAAISEAVAMAPFHTDDHWDKAVYLTNHTMLAIQSSKCHLSWSAHQDQARLDVIDALNQEVPRVASRLVWQAWYILAHISCMLTGRRGPAVARVYPRHPVM